MYRRFMKLLAPDGGAAGGSDKTDGASSDTSESDGKKVEGEAAKGADTQAAKTEGAQGDAKFTQADVNRIVSDRLAEEKTKAEKAEKDKKAKEAGDYETLLASRDSRITELEAQVAEKEKGSLRSKIANKHKLPEEAAARLIGETEAELEEDAKKLVALLKPATAQDTEAGKRNRSASGAGTGATGAASGSGKDQAAGQTKKTYAFQQPGDVAWD